MRRLVFPLGLFLASCTSQGNRYLVYDYVGDGQHVVAPVTIDTLRDPVHLAGDLGSASLGGRIVDGDEGLEWSVGPRVSLAHVVDDGVFVPLDDQGLILLSFYHHLEEARDDLARRGWRADMDAMLPLVTFAWAPEQVASTFLPIENAAYVSFGIHAFILYEEANLDVPLPAHAGVVRHEFGHTWFSLLLPEQEAPLADTILVEDIGSLNEGFADMVSLLALDDPEALPILGRDPRDDKDSQQYVVGDPYSLGTVFAAFSWDIRLLLDDAPRTLELVVAALRLWGDDVQTETRSPEAISYAISLYDLAAQETDDPRLCDAFRCRFPTMAGRCGQ